MDDVDDVDAMVHRRYGSIAVVRWILTMRPAEGVQARQAALFPRDPVHSAPPVSCRPHWSVVSSDLAWAPIMKGITSCDSGEMCIGTQWGNTVR